MCAFTAFDVGEITLEEFEGFLWLVIVKMTLCNNGQELDNVGVCREVRGNMFENFVKCFGLYTG